MSFDILEGLNETDINELYDDIVEGSVELANCVCLGASFAKTSLCSGSCNDTSYYGCRDICASIGLDWSKSKNDTNSNYWCYSDFRNGGAWCCGGIYQVSKGYDCYP